MAILYTLQKKKDDADKIVNEITLKSKAIEERIERTTTLLKSIETNDKEYQKLILNLQKIQETASDNVTKFKVEKDKINKLHSEIQKFYTSKYLPLVEKIENSETGFAIRIKSVNAAIKEIDKISSSCEAQFKKIKSYADRYTKALVSLEKLDKSIQKIYEKVQSNAANSETLTKAIQEAKKNTDLFGKEISTLRNKSVEYETKIQVLLQQAKSESENILSIKTKSESTLNEILNIYEIAADTGRSGEFDKRRKALTLELHKWEKHVTGSTIVLFAAIIGLFIWQLCLSNWNLKDLTMNLNFYCRFLLTSPIIYYVTFVSIQYNKTKKLVDTYSYKTTMAMSIKSHLELLSTNDSLKKYDKEILQFTLDAFNKIYKEPYDKNDDMKINLKILDMELKFEKNIMKELKEIKNEVTKVEKKINQEG